MSINISYVLKIKIIFLASPYLDIIYKHTLVLIFIFCTFFLIFLITPGFISIWTNHLSIFRKEMIAFKFYQLIFNPKIWKIFEFSSFEFIFKRNIRLILKLNFMIF